MTSTPQRRKGDRKLSWRSVIDSWQFWITLAFFVIGGLAIGLLLNHQGISNERAIREAAGIAREQACLRSRTVTYPKLNRYFAGERIVARALLKNAEVMHRITPPGTPIYRAQIQNIARLKKALAGIESFRLPVPTVAQCRAMAESD